MQDNDVPKNAAEGTGDTSAASAARATTVIEERGRGDVSAATIGRMLGLATLTDLTLLEKKVELLVSKINLLVAKMDKIASAIQQVPSGSDLERIDVQIGALKVLIKDVLVAKSVQEPATGDDRPLGENIVSNASEPKE
ncbi:MAG: hypothetical protein QY326_07325 [Bdellovibrionota bacterium]|nr:MAG: hypothetical protein QY326_07325 [Bdellovibrionota bacterium]